MILQASVGTRGEAEVIRGLTRPVSLVAFKAVKSGGVRKTFLLVAVPFATLEDRFLVLCGALPGGSGAKGEEIAPIDEMLIEVEIVEGDVSLTEEGMEVVARFTAYPGETFESTLDRIAPRSEMRSGRNVFVGEALYANSDSRLRPGMRGKVAVVGGREPFAWSLLRPAVNYVSFRLSFLVPFDTGEHGSIRSIDGGEGAPFVGDKFRGRGGTGPRLTNQKGDAERDGQHPNE